MALQQIVGRQQLGPESWDATRSDHSEEVERNKRKVRTMLNKLTWANLDSTSDQLVAWANESDTIHRLVVVLMLELLNDQGTQAKMYAELYRRWINKLPPRVESEMSNVNGNHMRDGRCISVHYLLSQCDQVCFGNLTRRAELEADITIGPFSEDNSLSEARPSSKDDCSRRADISSNDISESDTPQKVAPSRRGIYCFLAELFKSKVITEHQMNRAVENLTRNSDFLEEQYIDSLRSVLPLMSLDGLQGQQHRESDTNTRFDRLVRLSCTHTYRQFFSQHELRMIEDIIETRSQRWARAEAPTRTTQEETSVACTPTQLWTDDQRKSLLQIILNQPQLEFQTNTGNLQRLSWENLASIMNKRFNTKFHASGVKDQTDQIRQTFVDITFLRNRVGFQWDTQKSMLGASETTWDRLLEEPSHKKYAQLRQRPIEWYGLAERLFGGTSPESLGRSANLTTPRTSKRNNDAISSDEDIGIDSTLRFSPSPAFRAKKARRCEADIPVEGVDGVSAFVTSTPNVNIRANPAHQTEETSPSSTTTMRSMGPWVIHTNNVTFSLPHSNNNFYLGPSSSAACVPTGAQQSQVDITMENFDG
ncbi:hypothetical protein PGTUg99_001891 [Puccinia graminis f. sp. tritici]|uniref:Myb/SANT-like domain-containing protein n=1 Tax=Puccinia graminis f. sp. tritici TaxID=56615 RepID=A0A5B0Q192_PUCGR|nr:hypothetical protein PGTUg99_001891 [Puccinia graminis f. sp. tritici]